MHVTLEYIAVALIISVIILASFQVVGIVTSGFTHVREEQLYTVAERLMDKILLTTGYPVNWGTLITANITDFGLALNGTREPHVVDPDKVMRLVNYTWLKNPVYLDPQRVASLLGLIENGVPKYGFKLEIKPAYLLNVTPRGGGCTSWSGLIEMDLGNAVYRLKGVVSGRAKQPGTIILASGTVSYNTNDRIDVNIDLNGTVSELKVLSDHVAFSHVPVKRILVNGNPVAGSDEIVSWTFFHKSGRTAEFQIRFRSQGGRVHIRVNDATVFEEDPSYATVYVDIDVSQTGYRMDLSGTRLSILKGRGMVGVGEGCGWELPIPWGFDVKAVDWQGRPLPNVEVQAVYIVVWLETGGCGVGGGATYDYTVAVARGITGIDGVAKIDFVDYPPTVGTTSPGRVTGVLIVYGDWYGSRSVGHWVPLGGGLTTYLIGRLLIVPYNATILPRAAFLIKDVALEALPDLENVVEVQDVTLLCTGDEPPENATPACRVINSGAKKYRVYELEYVERLASHAIVVGCYRGRLTAVVGSKYPVAIYVYGTTINAQPVNQVVLTRLVHVMGYAYVIQLTVWRWAERGGRPG